jgi:TPR repeat protein
VFHTSRHAFCDSAATLGCVQHAKQLQSSGDVKGAKQWLERAAREGAAEAMFALAEVFIDEAEDSEDGKEIKQQVVANSGDEVMEEIKKLRKLNARRKKHMQHVPTGDKGFERLLIGMKWLCKGAVQG